MPFERSQQKQDLYLVFRKLFILAIPLFVLALPFLYLVASGEIYFDGIEGMVRCQTKHEICLIGPAYTNPGTQLKLQMTRTIKPEVLALGTSRIMTLRKDFFSHSFYNAGGGVVGLGDFRKFMSLLPSGYSPQILIVSLDQNFFNKNWDESAAPTREFEDGLAIDFGWQRVASVAFETFLDDIRRGKFDFGQIVSQLKRPRDFARMGLTANLRDSGFTNDGSRFYGNIFKLPPGSTPNYDDAFQRISDGNWKFEYGTEINEKAYRELNGFLDLCQSQNIHVVAFFPPYANQVFRKMQSMGEKYAYLGELYPKLSPLFLNHGDVLLDASDLRSLGATDVETLDALHGSEKAYLRLLIRLIELDPKLREAVQALPVLRERLNAVPYDYHLGKAY